MIHLPMIRQSQQGQANLTAIAILVGLIVTGVWVWKRLSLDMQEYVIDQALPVTAVALLIGTMLFTAVRKIRRRIRRRQERERLIAAFQREPARDKQLELSFALTR